jgi:hypothetical protein
MNPTLMQEMAAAIAADRHHEGERARAAAGARRTLRLRRRARRAVAGDAPAIARGLDPAPRA